MPSDRVLSIFSGIAQGAERASENIINVMMAKEKLNREHEAFKLDSKIKKLELQKAESEMLSPEQVKAEKERDKAKANFEKARYTLALGQIEDKESSLRKEYDASLAGLDTPGLGSFGGPPKQPTTLNKYLGALENKEYTDASKGIFIDESSTREDVEKVTNTTLGQGWKERYPEALKVINQNWPAEEGGERGSAETRFEELMKELNGDENAAYEQLLEEGF